LPHRCASSRSLAHRLTIAGTLALDVFTRLQTPLTPLLQFIQFFKLYTGYFILHTHFTIFTFSTQTIFQKQGGMSQRDVL
jgi:hypothetical protein